MTLDDSAADRLLTFCGRLPALPQDAAVGKREAAFVLDCFAQRQRALEVEGQAGNPGGQDLAAVRCELEALDAARRVIAQLLERRYGTSPNLG